MKLRGAARVFVDVKTHAISQGFSVEQLRNCGRRPTSTAKPISQVMGFRRRHSATKPTTSTKSPQVENRWAAMRLASAVAIINVGRHQASQRSRDMDDDTEVVPRSYAEKVQLAWSEETEPEREIQPKREIQPERETANALQFEDEADDEPGRTWEETWVPVALVVIAVSAVVGALLLLVPAHDSAPPIPAPVPSSQPIAPPQDLSPTFAPAPAPAPQTSPAPAPAAPPAQAPDATRITNSDGFSFVIPAGWVESAPQLEYVSEMLSKVSGAQPEPGNVMVDDDTRILMGKLDQKLYASAEPDTTKAAKRLASDMGEYFMPYPGNRISQATTPLSGNGMSGIASYYEIKFTDPAKPNGQIWTAVLGAPGTTQRWFMVWLGTINNPVDRGAAKALAESMRPANLT